MSDQNILLQRLNAAYDYLRSIGAIHTRKDFAETLSRPSSHISSAFKGDSKRLTKGLMERVGDVFPIFNLAWLLGEDVPMLKEGKANKASFAIEGSYREDEVPDRYMTYLVPMAAMGGSLTGFEESGVMRQNCERVISPIADADWAVPVCGDSMEPEYPNGSRVYVKQIDPCDFIAWGNVFVLDTTNGLIIKVVNQSERKDCVKCVSLNPSGRYQPFDVPMRSIRAMYRVLLCVSVK